MKKMKVLCLTDHTTHSDQNSVYSILSEMSVHPQCDYVHVASRGYEKNSSFFKGLDFRQIYAGRVDEKFSFNSNSHYFIDTSESQKTDQYDLILMRLPRPVSDYFLLTLENYFSNICIINKPSGIIECSSKEVLLKFQDYTPPVKLCKSIDDIRDFNNKYNLVLKPLREYGGKGIIRIKDGRVHDGQSSHNPEDYLSSLKVQVENEGLLAMKYLSNVHKGDKRLIVVDGEILAASLRLPPKDSWLCNVSMGGTSVNAEPDSDELEIVEGINPFLRSKGILIYGVDTLVNDQGIRKLSEINALSIGGFPQAQKQTGIPIIKMTIEKIFDYARHY